MTVVRIDNRDGRTMGRVMFANTFGQVRITRQFRDTDTMKAFVAEQRKLECDWRIANFVD